MNSIPSYQKFRSSSAVRGVVVALASAIMLCACGREGDEPSPRALALPAGVHSQPQALAVGQQRPVASAPAEDAKTSHSRPDVGEVLGIEPIMARPKPTGAGAIIGGVAGGVIGHQVGSGRGNQAATVVGAIGGAVAGHQIEKHRAKKVVGYHVRVKLETGEERVVRANRLQGLRVGDQVRIGPKSQLNRI